MARYAAVAAAAQAACASGDVAAVGKLMDANHAILQELTVSCGELEAIVDACRAAGALGAKLAGTGRGGIAVALCETVESQAAVAAALGECAAAKFVWQYTVDALSAKL
jgi:mevalonate kinase